MEYIRDRGPSADVPVAEILETFRRCHPQLTAGAPPSALGDPVQTGRLPDPG
jgi:hypothetical protein